LLEHTAGWLTRNRPSRVRPHTPVCWRHSRPMLKRRSVTRDFIIIKWKFLGMQPVSLTAQFYGNATYPAGTSSWSMRMQLAFLYPRLSNEQEKVMLEKKQKQLEREPR
jgi:hypothetical protein